MKKLIALFLVVCCLEVHAQNVTGNLNVTNAPVNTSTITFAGKVFTWTNGTPIGANAILITNTLGGDASNLFNVAGLVLPFNGVTITQTNGTNLIFFGSGMAMSLSASWASLVLTTNNNGQATNVTVPMSTIDASARTNIASQLVSDVNLNSTNAADQNSKFMSQEVGTTNTQTVSGNKAFSGSNNFAGIMVATNPANVFSGTFGGEGTFTGVTTFLNDVLGGGAIIYYQFLIADGSGYFANNAFNWDGLGNVVAKSFSGNGAGLTNLNATNLTAGTIPNARYGTVTNLSVSGTNTINAAVVETIFNNTSIVSTGNAVNSDVATGTNAIVFLSGASAPFGIAGFAGGIPDRIVIVQSGIGQAWTNMYQSGQESTAANRIINPTGANIVIPAFGSLMMRYDGSASVWRVMFATGN